jgi:hypothetical protein
VTIEPAAPKRAMRRVDHDRSQHRPDGRNFLRPDANIDSVLERKPAHRFKISNARRVRRGALLGTFDVELTSCGIALSGAMLLEMGGQRWVTLPVVEFVSPAARERFLGDILPLAEEALR